MVRMESLDILVRQVLPQVLPCPRGMVLDALQAVAKHFCEQTAVWRERLEETGLQGEADIPLSLPTGSRLVMILGVWLDGNRLLPDDYRAEGNSLCLRTVLPRECSVVVDAALRPSRLSERLPEQLIEAWGDVLAYGALARLKAMSGQHVTWTDAAGAQMALEQYNEGVARARIRAMSR